jgi:hypothetical protein
VVSQTACRDIAPVLFVLDAWKVGDRLGVDEAEVKLVVLDGKSEPVAHEVDIALDGLRGDFELVGELAAIWEAPCLNLPVKLKHSFQRRP